MTKFQGESLAAGYNWCQGPVPGRGPAVEKHWSTASVRNVSHSKKKWARCDHKWALDIRV